MAVAIALVRDVAEGVGHGDHLGRAGVDALPRLGCVLPCFSTAPGEPQQRRDGQREGDPGHRCSAWCAAWRAAYIAAALASGMRISAIHGFSGAPESGLLERGGERRIREPLALLLEILSAHRLAHRALP